MSGLVLHHEDMYGRSSLNRLSTLATTPRHPQGTAALDPAIVAKYNAIPQVSPR